MNEMTLIRKNMVCAYEYNGGGYITDQQIGMGANNSHAHMRMHTLTQQINTSQMTSHITKIQTYLKAAQTDIKHLPNVTLRDEIE